MDPNNRPILDDSVEANREREHKQGIADDAKHDICIELTIDEQTVSRRFRLEDVAHRDWNPIINGMSDEIERL